MVGLLLAKHRKDYFRLAWKYKKWPGRVYDIAHGSRAKTEKEKKIVEELLNLGIIHRRHRRND